MKTIFMTGGGGSGTIAATKSLKETGKYKIILGDMDKWAAGLRFADKPYILPAGKDERFLDVVQDIIKKEKVDIFIPLVDEEILKSYEIVKNMPKVELLLPEYNFAKIALDKWILFKKLKKFKIPCPETYLGNFLLETPYIVKPRIGRGSRNVKEIKSKKEYEAYKVLTGLPESKILSQNKIIGKEFTVSVVANKYGEVLAVVPKEVIYKRGITIVAITRVNKEIESLCIEIQKRLKANGPFNVQLILREDGLPIVFEINPRFSTTIALTTKAGVNEIDILASDYRFSGKLLPFEENLVMSRFYDQIYFKE